jgi:amino acid transporter
MYIIISCLLLVCERSDVDVVDFVGRRSNKGKAVVCLNLSAIMSVYLCGFYSFKPSVEICLVLNFVADMILYCLIFFLIPQHPKKNLTKAVDKREPNEGFLGFSAAAETTDQH